MKFFVDTADIKQIEELIPTGFVNGVTTNPSLIAKNGDDMAKTIKAICSIVDGPVSAEVTATDFDTMLQEGEYLASLAKNVAVKVPLTPNGLRTCKTLRDKNIMVNVTLCFTAAQALLAAKAGASEHNEIQMFWATGEAAETVMIFKEHVKVTMLDTIYLPGSWRRVEVALIEGATEHDEELSMLIYNTHQPSSKLRPFRPPKKDRVL